VVSKEQYQLILDDYYFLNDVIYKKLFPKRPFGVNCSPIVFHASEMLRKPKNSNYNLYLDNEAPDEIIFEAFEGIVKIINKYNLKIVRLGYSNYSIIKEALKLDEKLNGLNMMYMGKFFSEINYDNESVIAMDGTDSKMINLISSMFVCSRAANAHKIKSIINSNLFCGNVFYTNIQYSELIQLVDCIAYLLKKKTLST
jgi:hypothetical protein